MNMINAKKVRSYFPSVIKTAALCFYAVSGCVMAIACGVKARPLPPLEPAEIGRGVPTYKRAAEQAKPAVVPDSISVKPSASPTLAPDRRGQ